MQNRDFNSAFNDWYVVDQGDEMVTLRCRDTNELATIHLDELQAMGG